MTIAKRLIDARPPLWTVLFAISAILFVGGAVVYALAGLRDQALVGGVGALVSVLVIVAFTGRDRPRPG